VGHNHTSPPKSGSIKFEFDKDWIGGKGWVIHVIITDNQRGGGTPSLHHHGY